MFIGMRVGTGEHHCRSYISVGSSCSLSNEAGSVRCLLPPAVGWGKSRGRTQQLGQGHREQAGGGMLTSGGYASSAACYGR